MPNTFFAGFFFGIGLAFLFTWWFALIIYITPDYQMICLGDNCIMTDSGNFITK